MTNPIINEVMTMTVKELRVKARELNLKGFHAMAKPAMQQAITDYILAGIPAANEVSRNDIINGDDNNNPHDDFFTPDPHGDVQLHQPAANEVSGKIIEFVKADNTQVCFFAKGKKVRIYWDDTTYKLTMHSERRGRKATKYAELIRMMKPFTNGVHGDVAQVVKAIVRLKDMPATIKVHRHNKLVAEGRVTPSSRTKENDTTAKRTKGKVDPQWMQRFVEFCEDTIGRRPTGLEIQTEWNLYIAE